MASVTAGAVLRLVEVRWWPGSVAEAEFRELIIRAGLPQPMFNEPVRRQAGGAAVMHEQLGCG